MTISIGNTAWQRGRQGGRLRGGETSKGAQPVALHVNFSLQKSDLETQNTGRVTLWNLNPSQLAVLNEKDCVVSLKAGYGSKLALIFAGIVSYVSTTIDSADRKTEIEVIDNLVEIRDTYVSVSYNGTVNWKIIFDDVAAQMGVAVSYPITPSSWTSPTASVSWAWLGIL